MPEAPESEPYVEYEITVTVHAPMGDPEPKNWNWSELIDMGDSIQFHSQRIVRMYDHAIDPDDWEALPPEARAFWLAGVQRRENDDV